MVIEMKRREPGEPDYATCVQTREKLRAVRKLLERPTAESVEDCGLLLREAVDQMQLLERRLRSGVHQGNREGLSRDLNGLRAELNTIQSMLEQAVCFHLAWAQMLGAAAGGYTQKGRARELEIRPRVSIEG